MEFISLIIIFLLSTLVILLLVLLWIYLQFKKAVKSSGLSRSDLKELLKKGEYESKYRQKSISGLSSILAPQIQKDYSNFNESELYNKVENSLLAIFNSITNKEVSSSTELNLIRDRIEELVDNQKHNEIEEKFNDIKFHKHTIKGYEKKNGCLNITVASSLEYYYYKSKRGKVEKEYKEYKKQTSYTTKYVHIYDPEVYKTTTYSLSAHCPNCGAVLKNYANNHCDFCGSGIEPINLKSWFISDYKEDER